MEHCKGHGIVDKTIKAPLSPTLPKVHIQKCQVLCPKLQAQLNQMACRQRGVLETKDRKISVKPPS